MKIDDGTTCPEVDLLRPIAVSQALVKRATAMGNEEITLIPLGKLYTNDVKAGGRQYNIAYKWHTCITGGINVHLQQKTQSRSEGSGSHHGSRFEE